MSTASLNVYSEIVASLPRRRAEVFAALKSLPYDKRTMPNVCTMLGLRPHQISGRLTELCDDGLLAAWSLDGRYTKYIIVAPEQVDAAKEEAQRFKFQTDVRNFLNKHGDKLHPSDRIRLSTYE